MKPLLQLKRKSWLRPSQERHPKARQVKTHNNPTKQYRLRLTDFQVMLRAKVCRQQRLRNRTRAEIALAGILDDLYESEKIVQNGNRSVLLDFFVASAKVGSKSMARPIGSENLRCWPGQVAAEAARHSHCPAHER